MSKDTNSGDWNTGDGNTGDGNTGNRNTGDGNTGYGNSSSRQSGIFNSSEGTVRAFNLDSGKTWNEIDHPHFKEFHLSKWIPWSDMTATDRKEHPEADTTGGLLRTYTYKEAWANFWRDTDEENRKKFLNLPNFDAVIFLEITGIDVRENNKKQELLDKANELIEKAQGLKKQASKL